jgi:hypothetical protein
MSEDQDQDFTDEDESQEDSPVLKELRSQLRASQKDVEKLRSLQAEVDARTQSMRAESAQSAVNSLGMEGLVEDVLNWVEGEITLEKTIAALQSRNIPLPDGTEKPEPQSPETPNPSKIGQQVADAAAGSAVKSIDERLAQAETGREVQGIMEEAGLTRSHS